MELNISDKDQGISKEVDPDIFETLGLKLVKTFVDQINGDCRVFGDKGTKWTITFEAPEMTPNLGEVMPF